MLKLESKGIINGKISDKYGKYSDDKVDGIPQLSIPIEWKNVPCGTRSFAVSIWDFDNIKEEGFTFLHWIAANIPEYINMLEEDASRTEKWLVQGKNGWIVDYQHDRENILCNRYGGPASLSEQHEYEIRLYALSERLNLEQGFYYNNFLKKSRGKILEEAVIYGTYGR